MGTRSENAPDEAAAAGRVVDLAAFRAGRAQRPTADGSIALPGRPAGLSPRQAAHRRRMLVHLLNVAAARAGLR